MNSRQLRDLGVPEHLLSVAILACRKASSEHLLKEQVVAGIREAVKGEVINECFAALAEEITKPMPKMHDPVPYQVWGDEIDENTFEQMKMACRVPSAIRGALMPDAHLGYGLPIGGVLATSGTVIPYAVGVDIACRMRLSIVDLPVSKFKNTYSMKQALMERTKFGVGSEHQKPLDHPVLDKDWNLTKVTKANKDKARKQLGTSGSGNHFVEFGELIVNESIDGLEPGRYVALLSHSGSRGAGAAVCNTYSEVAQSRLPSYYRELGKLGWLDLASEDGQAYWWAMNLMGEYAAANHECLHKEVCDFLGTEVLKVVENHHNFAWKETHNEQELIVHRKGATPAGLGELGVIPGSMATPAFLVRGKGNAASLNSASHGAGRCMSRRKAMEQFNFKAIQGNLLKKGVEILSAGADEVPYVYKDIHKVMASQKDLVDVLAEFHPRVVRMSGDGTSED